MNRNIEKLPVKSATIEYVDTFLSNPDSVKDELMNTLKFDIKPLEGRPTALYGDEGIY